MVIRIDNTRSQVIGSFEELKAVNNYLKVQLPDYKKTDAYIDHGWDGYIHLITKAGTVATGLMPLIAKNFPCHIQDMRTVPQPTRLITKVGKFDLKDYKGSDYQYQAVLTCLNNSIGTVPFPRGIINAATNAGKNTIIASIAGSYNIPVLMTIHDADVFRQAVDFFSEFFKVGTITSKGIKIEDFTIAMYKSLYNRSGRTNVLKYLKGVPILIVDESHATGATDYKKLISKIHSPVRYFFSGTALDRPSPLDNVNMVGMCGPKIVDISNSKLIELGVSKRPVVYIFRNRPGGFYFDYKEKVQEVIKHSRVKNDFIRNLCKDDKQTLISVRNIDHGEYLCRYLQGINRRVVFLHGESEFREEVIRDLKAREIDTVVTTVMRVGINIPSFKRFINAHGGMSEIELKQLMGRIFRDDGEDDHIEFFDFYDDVEPLNEHSRARIDIYEREGFEIIYL